ncbi:MAG TPA: serine/threonine-protein kinase [Kofleriaceae bacterium]|nr:serine/threonine-protein kinase [Kofleriaceae bacterium]
MASGGMAVVYRAVQEQLNRVVAIKALKTSVSGDEQLVTRFEREARSLAGLQHENIIHVYDFHRERGALFIVMEYVRGIDLYDLLERCGRLPYDVAAVVAMQVARALDYVHYRGIVHRDIKPANIMIARQGGVKLMDFGIARDQNYDNDLTMTGTGIGTPSYMSPEQILGDRPDARSDIFSLGIVLYQMVTGRKPFIEDEEKSVMHKIRLERHVRARKLNAEMPRELGRIIDKCLHKEPRNRFQSGQALVMALERFLAKHVEMNYHSRLVLFLRNQDIITKLEADEYLNPATTGPGSAVATQHSLTARRAVRRGLAIQGSIAGVVALVVALLHLAPVGAEVPPPAAPVAMPAPPQRGYLRVVVRPWGRIFVDGVERGMTPMAKPLALPAGRHQVTIRNDYYEPIERSVTVPAGDESSATLLELDLRTGTRILHFAPDEVKR